MKSLLVFIRIIIVGCLWSIIFVEGIRVIMLCNWHFDIFWPDHWRQAYTLWKAGWIMKAPKEWAFVLILVTFFPMLITGWWTLNMISWEKIIYDLFMLPKTIYRKLIKTPINVMTTSNKYGVVKKKSYKQIRPAGVGSVKVPISDNSENKTIPSALVSARTSLSSLTPKQTAPVKKKTDIPATIDHALFKFDDDDDDFDLDIDSFEKTDIAKKQDKKNNSENKEDKSGNERKENSRKNKRNSFDDEEFDTSSKPNKEKRRENKNQQKRNDTDKVSKDNDFEKKNDKNKTNDGEQKTSKGPVFETLSQKGFDIISGVSVGNTIIDYIGVAENEICLCLVDKENGDWLADEELFNGEEPLWFSENSHRISPVRNLDVARNKIKDKLDDEGFEQPIKAFVVVQMANIINADDMFDIWNDLDISVTRINRGSPKEIPLFSKTLSEAENAIPSKDMDKLRKVLKNIK